MKKQVYLELSLNQLNFDIGVHESAFPRHQVIYQTEQKLIQHARPIQYGSIYKPHLFLEIEEEHYDKIFKHMHRLDDDYAIIKAIVLYVCINREDLRESEYDSIEYTIAQIVSLGPYFRPFNSLIAYLSGVRYPNQPLGAIGARAIKYGRYRASLRKKRAELLAMLKEPSRQLTNTIGSLPAALPQLVYNSLQTGVQKLEENIQRGLSPSELFFYLLDLQSCSLGKRAASAHADESHQA